MDGWCIANALPLGRMRARLIDARSELVIVLVEFTTRVEHREIKGKADG